MKCDAENTDSGNSHWSSCYCAEDQGSGYTFDDEYGACDFCLGKFLPGQVICAGSDGVMRVCPEERNNVQIMGHTESSRAVW